MNDKPVPSSFSDLELVRHIEAHYTNLEGNIETAVKRLGDLASSIDAVENAIQECINNTIELKKSINEQLNDNVREFKELLAEIQGI